MPHTGDRFWGALAIQSFMQKRKETVGSVVATRSSTGGTGHLGSSHLPVPHLTDSPGTREMPVQEGGSVPRALPATSQPPLHRPSKPWFQLVPFTHGLIQFPTPKETLAMAIGMWGQYPWSLLAIFVFKVPLNLDQPGAAYRGEQRQRTRNELCQRMLA